jgi:hypothetical protein
MPTATATQQWQCACGLCGAKLFKKENETDYKFFLNRFTSSVAFFITKGHNVDACAKVGA